MLNLFIETFLFFIDGFPPGIDCRIFMDFCDCRLRKWVDKAAYWV